MFPSLFCSSQSGESSETEDDKNELPPRSIVDNSVNDRTPTSASLPNERLSSSRSSSPGLASEIMRRPRSPAVKLFNIQPQQPVQGAISADFQHRITGASTH